MIERELIEAVPKSDIHTHLDGSMRLSTLIELARDRGVALPSYEAEGLKELVFVIGGPYGFPESVYEKAESKISLSKMTFSHQLARLLCVEQIYRAFTIIKGEPYHHE